MYGNWAENFISRPIVSASKSENFSGFIYNLHDITSTNAGKVIFGCGRSWTSANFTVNIIAIGRWKN